MKWLAVFVLLAVSWVRADSYTPPQPAKDVAVISETWRDDARQRDVPVKIYLPQGAGPFPVVIFSHGLGGSRDGYEYLGRWWAGCGYVTVHLQHAGSDDTVWKDVPAAGRRKALTDSVLDVSNALNRMLDVRFAIDELTRQNQNAKSPLHDHLDLAHIGMAGHSFGGWTTMAVAGQAPGPGGRPVADPRISAAVQMSAPAASWQLRKDSLSGITIPVLHLTGTLDDSPIGETKAAERRKLYDGMDHAETALIIFNGADHMTFADPLTGQRLRVSAAADHNAEFQHLICLASTAWWDAWLRGDAAARNWIAGGGLKTTLGSDGTLELKKP